MDNLIDWHVADFKYLMSSLRGQRIAVAPIPYGKLLFAVQMVWAWTAYKVPLMPYLFCEEQMTDFSKHMQLREQLKEHYYSFKGQRYI